MEIQMEIMILQIQYSIKTPGTGGQFLFYRSGAKNDMAIW